MKVFYVCSYNSNIIGQAYPKDDYLDAFHFCNAVRTNEFTERFYLHIQNGKILVDQSNIALARHAFGTFIAKRIASEVSWPSPVLVPMPSPDALIGVSSYRSWRMLSEAMASTELKLSPVDALFWADGPPHDLVNADPGKRHILSQSMLCDFPLRGQAVVLVDDLVSSGTTLLAARDCLEAEGAAILGAIVCGRVRHDFQTPPFGVQEVWLDEDGRCSDHDSY